MRKREHKSDMTNRLVVKKETLRHLQTLGDDDLRRVGGGSHGAPSTGYCRDG